MAKSIPTDLAALLESLSVNNVGSVDEHALSNLLGVSVPLDAGVEGAAGFFAKGLGLKADNSLVQIATYVLTKAAILETVQLIGVGGWAYVSKKTRNEVTRRSEDGLRRGVALGKNVTTSKLRLDSGE